MGVTCKSCVFFPSDYDTHSTGIGCNYALITGTTRTATFRKKLGKAAPPEYISAKLREKPCGLYKRDPLKSGKKKEAENDRDQERPPMAGQSAEH